jgi:hypothetical protein
MSTADCGCHGYQGEIHFDPSRPDGKPRKLRDVSPIDALDRPVTTLLREGLHRMYADVLHDLLRPAPKRRTHFA